MNEWLAELTRVPEVTFGAPARAWFGVPLAAALLLVLAARRRGRRALASLVLRGLVLAALLAVLLEPGVTERETRTGRLVVLTDVSRSVGEEGIALARRYAGKAPATAVRADFASGVGLATGGDGATDIAAALRYAAVHASPGAPLRVVLLSDGRATEPGAEHAALELRRGGAEVFSVAIPEHPRAHPPALVALRLAAPPREERREPFALTLRVHAAKATRAAATLFLDGAVQRTREVDLPPGESEVAFPDLHLAPGRYYAQVVLDGDGSPHDNVADLELEVPRVPRVLCVAAKPRRALLAEALERQGIEVEVRGTGDPLDLGSWDTVVLLPDAPVEAIEAHATDLADFVGRRGGGLVAIGGESGDGLARFHGTPVAFLLPIEVPPRKPPEPEPSPVPEPEPEPHVEIVEEERQAYPITLCVVFDRSGSMGAEGKLQRAKLAAAAAAYALTDQDRIAVITFGDDARVDLSPRPAGNPEAVLRVLRPIEASGQTAMYQALERAYRLLAGETSAIRHVVLMTDGLSSDEGDWHRLVTGGARDKITLSSVCIGWESTDRRLLSQLAQWGRGKYWSANHAHEIPQVVTQDTLRVVTARDRRGQDAERTHTKPDETREEPPKPEPATTPDRPPPPTPAAVPIVPQPAAPREMLKGIPDEDLPAVSGFEEGAPRFASWVAARAGADGPPLLAYWRVGLGTVAALTLDPEAPGELRSHRELPRLLAQLVRSVLPDVAGTPFAVRLARRGTGPDERLVVRVVGEDGLARTDLPLDVRVGDEPAAPRRGADAYEVALPVRAEVARASVRLGPADAPLAERTFVLPPSANRELEHTGPDRAALVRLAGDPARVDAPAGVALRLPEALVERTRPLRLPFLLLAAILLPFDAWARRRARSGSR